MTIYILLPEQVRTNAWPHGSAYAHANRSANASADNNAYDGVPNGRRGGGDWRNGRAGSQARRGGANARRNLWCLAGCMVMAYVVMAHIVMVCMVMGYVVMAYLAMTYVVVANIMLPFVGQI